MFAKVEITGKLNLLTGMHIGGSSAFSAIGAVDSPVVRDPLTDLPMVPGSSLKGKLRALLAQKYNVGPTKTCDEDAAPIRRLFGSAEKNHPRNSRLIFRDMVLENYPALREQGLLAPTEVKFENTINRLTAVANPRQIERAVRGSSFPLSVVYNVAEGAADGEMEEDFALLTEAMRLLTYDYLGGHGSRGYGRVAFAELAVKPVVGEVPADRLAACQKLLEDVE